MKSKKIPSWEPSYPLPSHFWVDDFSQLPIAGVWPCSLESSSARRDFFNRKLHAFGALAALAYLQDPLQEDGQEVGVVGAMQCDEIKAFEGSSQDEVSG